MTSKEKNARQVLIDSGWLAIHDTEVETDAWLKGYDACFSKMRSEHDPVKELKQYEETKQYGFDIAVRLSSYSKKERSKMFGVKKKHANIKRIARYFTVNDIIDKMNEYEAEKEAERFFDDLGQEE